MRKPKARPPANVAQDNPHAGPSHVEGQPSIPGGQPLGKPQPKADFFKRTEGSMNEGGHAFRADPAEDYHASG